MTAVDLFAGGAGAGNPGRRTSGPRGSRPTGAAVTAPTPPPTPGDDEMLRQRIGELLDLGKSPEEAVDSVIANAKVDERHEFLRELLLAEAKSASRSRTHTRERRCAARIAAGGDPVTARRELVSDSFLLPDGEWVRHLEASADQHLARSGWLKVQAKGLYATAQFHEDCATAITSAKASCLADLDSMLRPAAA